MEWNDVKEKLSDPDFAFGKKVGIADHLYGDISYILNMINRLMVCMKDTNKKYGAECEFFRLDFREPYFDEQMEFPLGSLILDMKWGCREELEKKD